MSKNGFTVLEVVVAVAIISILAAVAVTDFALQKKKTELKNWSEYL